NIADRVPRGFLRPATDVDCGPARRFRSNCNPTADRTLRYSTKGWPLKAETLEGLPLHQMNEGTVSSPARVSVPRLVVQEIAMNRRRLYTLPASRAPSFGDDRDRHSGYRSRLKL